MATHDKQAGTGKAAKRKFSEMSPGGKAAHIGKIVIFFISFGFAFPSIFSD